MRFQTTALSSATLHTTTTLARLFGAAALALVLAMIPVVAAEAATRPATASTEGLQATAGGDMLVIATGLSIGGALEAAARATDMSAGRAAQGEPLVDRAGLPGGLKPTTGFWMICDWFSGYCMACDGSGNCKFRRI
jgi:hypothetical protein